MSKTCPKLHTINFSGCFRLTDDAIEVLLMNCPGEYAMRKSMEVYQVD